MSNSITVTSDDYNNICRLLDNIPNCSDELLKLEDEIDRALIVRCTRDRQQYCHDEL